MSAFETRPNVFFIRLDGRRLRVPQCDSMESHANIYAKSQRQKPPEKLKANLTSSGVDIIAVKYGALLPLLLMCFINVSKQAYGSTVVRLVSGTEGALLLKVNNM